jgi:leucine dehydrogenase
LKGRKIIVQGVGHVGENLVSLLTKEGAEVSIVDINQEQLKKVAAQTGAKVLTDTDFYGLDMDIYAPCALGATLNSDNISKLKCAIVAGAANNQLADETIHGKMLLEKGIIYAPDFLINAGGLINVYSELTGYNRERAIQRTEKIYEYTLEILKNASSENIPTYLAATRMAEKRISDIGKVKLGF